LEMAEGKAPYGDIHPMRAIFMIPSKPPPSFSEPDKWSPAFIDFVSRCLVKNPGEKNTNIIGATTLSITTLSTMGLFVKLSINDTQHRYLAELYCEPLC
jgi:serine/threonine protein kinase